MKLLLTTDVAGGVWDHSVELTRGLVAQGVDVTVAVLGAPSAERLAELPPAAHVETLDVPLEWMPGGTEQVARAGAWIGRLADAHDADVVHLNQPSYAPAVTRPTLVAVHGDVWSWFGEVRGQEPPGERWAAYRDAIREGLGAAGLVVAPSRYQAELVGSHYGPRTVAVVWNGTAPPTRAGGVAPPLARHAEGPRAARPWTLVSAGRAWDEAKGTAVIDAALGRLGGSWQGYLAGQTQGPEGQRTEATYLRVLGPVPKAQLWRLFRRAHVYVGASLYEPFGLAPVEAALAGCALVLSDIPSFRELWQEDALFFPKRDASGLADRLEELRSEPARIDEWGRRAARRAGSHFSVGRMTAEYLALYRSLLHAGEGVVRPPASEEIPCG